MDVNLYQHPAFDLFDIVGKKVMDEQLEYSDYLQKFCRIHIRIKDFNVIYQAERTDTNCTITSEIIIYRLFQNGRLSKVKHNIFADLMTLETSDLFQESYDITQCFCIEYNKLQSIYNHFGVEMTQTIRQYKQLVPSKVQVREIMNLFPLDPEILQVPCISEVKMNRTINFGTVNMQILVPQVSAVPYFCEYALQLKTPNDLFHFHLVNPYFPMQIVNDLLNHKSIPKEGIVSNTEAEIGVLEKNIQNLVQQLPDTPTRTHLLEYIQKEPTCVPERQLKFTWVKYL